MATVNPSNPSTCCNYQADYECTKKTTLDCFLKISQVVFGVLILLGGYNYLTNYTGAYAHFVGSLCLIGGSLLILCNLWMLYEKLPCCNDTSTEPSSNPPPQITAHLERSQNHPRNPFQ